MARNVLVYAAEPGPAEYVAQRAAAMGDDLGLVLTAIDFHREKVSGGRIEESRDYGSASFNTFDEPVFIGSAIAQLAGHAEAVVVDAIEDWAARLLLRFPGDPVELDAEVASLHSVMHARMTELILVARPDRVATSAKALLARMLPVLESKCDVVIDLRGGAPRATKGAL
jgi:adenosyl cobinamide kinase/adenosyl cobinamide phosphate guanylyltransferase